MVIQYISRYISSKFVLFVFCLISGLDTLSILHAHMGACAAISWTPNGSNIFLRGRNLRFFSPEINKRTCLYIRYLILRTNQCLIYYISFQSWFAVKNSKKSPNQETALGNRGILDDLNDTKLVLNYVHLGPIWYNS